MSVMYLRTEQLSSLLTEDEQLACLMTGLVKVFLWLSGVYIGRFGGLRTSQYVQIYIGRFRSYTSAVSGVTHRPFQELYIGRFRIYTSAVLGVKHRPFQELYIGRFGGLQTFQCVLHSCSSAELSICPTNGP
jgi:hypothetical protein